MKDEQSLQQAVLVYRCQLCQTVVSAGIKSVRIPVETRSREYPRRLKVFRIRRNNKNETIDDPGGYGWEIVREAVVCPSCAKHYSAKHKLT